MKKLLIACGITAGVLLVGGALAYREFMKADWLDLEFRQDDRCYLTNAEEAQWNEQKNS